MMGRTALLAVLVACACGSAQAQPLAALRIGEPRAIEGLQSAAGVNQRLRWLALPGGGHLAALRIASPGAAALRVALRVGDMPRATILRFYAPGESRSREVGGAVVIDALERNGAAGENGPDARTWWSPVVGGDALVAEIELPPGADPSRIAIALPMVSHIATWPAGDAGDDGNAIAIVTTAGVTYACPGVLVTARDTRSPGPYLVTRNGCVASQASATSMQAIWHADASGVGARLLYSSADTDTAFVSLDEPPSGISRLSRNDAPAPDPALEQWLGARAASQPTIGAFSSP